MSNENRIHEKSRTPKNSVMYEKLMPVLLIAMGVLTVILIGFAVALLLGFIRL